MLIASVLLLPCAVNIVWKEPVSLIPVIVLTAVPGSAIGDAIEKLRKKAFKIILFKNIACSSCFIPYNL